MLWLWMLWLMLFLLFRSTGAGAAPQHNFLHGHGSRAFGLGRGSRIERPPRRSGRIGTLPSDQERIPGSVVIDSVVDSVAMVVAVVVVFGRRPTGRRHRGGTLMFLTRRMWQRLWRNGEGWCTTTIIRVGNGGAADGRGLGGVGSSRAGGCTSTAPWVILPGRQRGRAHPHSTFFYDLDVLPAAAS